MGKAPENKEIHDYVITHIDDAISNEWIKVYYQPVVRALTGQLCSAEALARWIDPVHGFLSPDKFIGALEESELIHKLDCFIVEKVCREIHEHVISGKPAFQVSINFSRLDFIKCDMLEIVEKNIEKYNIPRDYLHFEITESMIAQDEELMRDNIERFRQRGYEIWMDDFGSGYSSLTLLQDYDFDQIKLDMRFLFSMTEKSMEIVRSTINMAKRIGVKTLCEGVETKEQVDFLTLIGCGKFQGYYFGKPQPYDEMLESMLEKNITLEKRSWHNYYEIASISALDTDRPLEIVEYDGNTFNTLFMNDRYKEQIFMSSSDLAEIDKIIYNPQSQYMPQYKKFAEKAIRTRSLESFYYTIRGNYFQLKVMYLAENENKYLFKGSINNISFDQNTKERDSLDRRLRELNHLHEVVLLINYKEDIVFPLLGGYLYLNDVTEQALSFDEGHRTFADECIFPDDRDAYIEFTDYVNIQQRAKSDMQKGFNKKTFRIKQKDGSYEWREFALLPIPGTSGAEYLFIISKLADELVASLDNTIYPTFKPGGNMDDETITEYARLWYSLITSSSYKLFWKDKDRRFKGVSRSFLNFYEIKSMDDILGKNDEDMHWHVDEGPYQGDELDVLHKGTTVFNAPGQCIVNGVVHNIICNKIPVYDKGEIVGLVGSFADVDQEIYRVQKLVNPSKVDTATRLMNNKFFMLTMMDYAAQYNEAGKNYAYIVMHNKNQHRIEETYGSKIAAAVLKEIGEKIIDVINQSAVGSRLKEAYFGIIIFIESREKLEELAEQLKAHIEEITSVNGKSVTVRMTTACHLRTDEGMTDETIYPLTLKEVDDMEGNNTPIDS
jgi:EAL domain-containing protein (putative c-di-GMP-specific phosphodiesterase class I)/GGDEF domain-containing protein